jgi:hypothetical protein
MRRPQEAGREKEAMTMSRILRLLGAGLLLASFVSAPKAIAHGDSAAESESEHHGELEALADPRVPNNGAAIRIVSPADGSVCPAGMDIEVCVELEHFALGQDGNHWHISVDGEPWSMVMVDSLKEVLYGLEPGEHTIEVLLADGEHRDLEEGDEIRVVVR